MKRVNQELRQVVFELGLSYRQIAHEMGISPVWLSRALSRELTVEMRERITRAIKRLTTPEREVG